MCLRCERFNRAHDIVVAGATADVAGQVVAYFALGRMGVQLQELANAHDHPSRAETALQGVVLLEGRLNRMQLTVARREALNRRDRRSIGHHRENRAGFDRLPIDIDGASAALRRVATDMRSGEAEIVSYQVNQQFPRLDGNASSGTVDFNCYRVTAFIGIDH
jgi:hypothetical protein